MLRTLSELLILAALLTGCLTPATISPTRYYTISSTSVTPGNVTDPRSLGIRPLIAAKPYKLEIAYRSESNRLAYFSRSEWAELPATMVSRSITDSIAGQHLFADVDDATAMARPDLILTGELRRFEADYTGESPAFVLLISASIRTTNDGESLWHDKIEVRIPLSGGREVEINSGDATLADIARAANDAVTQLSKELCARIQTVPRNVEKP